MPERATVLIVDDEEDIRFGFEDRFDERYRVLTAANGAEALDLLKREPGISAIVTDVRMPVMTGLELVKAGRGINPDVGFIVVSGHADTADVIQALRAGARNFLRKPYSLEDLEEALAAEVRNARIIRESREQADRTRDLERFVIGIDAVRLRIPTDLIWVNPLAFRIASLIGAASICGEDSQLNVALGLIEMLTNAIEHGNLEITGEEKVALMQNGEVRYIAELRRRAQEEPYRSRHISVVLQIDPDQATIEIEDEGPGFDTTNLPDPDDLERLFTPSGRGILLTRAYLDEVTYNANGNGVRLVKRRESRVN
jgi:CheY-like chemotaxis protein